MPRKKRAVQAPEQRPEEQVLEQPTVDALLSDDQQPQQDDVAPADDQDIVAPDISATTAEPAPEVEEPDVVPLSEQEVAPVPDTSPNPSENAPSLEDAAEPAPAAMAQAPASQPLLFNVHINGESGNQDILSTADVEISGVGTIRNVKIKSDDYGISVVMPRTKIADLGRFKDSFFFNDREQRNQFDAAVLDAYQQELVQNMEPGEQLDDLDEESGHIMEQSM